MAKVKDLYNTIYDLDFNNDDLLSMVREVNGYDDSLDYLDYWENDEEFFDTFYYDRPMELARAIYYGGYSFTDAYVKINAYGNLESIDSWELNNELQDNKIDIIDNYINISDDNYYIIQALNNDNSLNEEDKEALLYLLNK